MQGLDVHSIRNTNHQVLSGSPNAAHLPEKKKSLPWVYSLHGAPEIPEIVWDITHFMTMPGYRTNFPKLGISLTIA